ncbi:DUF241 domain protein (DUF241) [Tasmannia lanceolata]|uniref:DUF241 domain protein (DUF241) n=1 Tax=Tasmannia lanceolata TaxID=3420 RepID=UPI0040649955
MVTGFRRSISLPKPYRPESTPEKSYHVRSTSLPCTSHPLISQLKDHLNILKTWEAEPGSHTSAWLCAGLSRLKNVLDSLDDLLQLTQSQDSLHRQSHFIEKLLEHFLKFVDVYGIFRAVLLALKEEQLAAQVAIRSRRDELKISSYIKARKKMDKEILKLVSVVRDIGREKDYVSVSVSDSDTELVGILREVNLVTVGVSVAVFCGILGSRLTRNWMGLKFWKKKERGDEIREFRDAKMGDLRGLRKREEKEEEKLKIVLRRLEDLEDCIGRMEKESERVFRSLINTRVSLLNILTQ